MYQPDLRHHLDADPHQTEIEHGPNRLTVWTFTLPQRGRTPSSCSCYPLSWQTEVLTVQCLPRSIGIALLSFREAREN